MNKSAIALAVAAALAASATAQAETTLYGSARVSVDYQKADVLRFEEVQDVVDVFDDGVWDVNNNSSRLGVKGFEDLGNGLSAIYQFEFGVDGTDGGNFNSNRPKLVGLKGGFGTVTLGNQWSPYYNVTGIADTFNNSALFAYVDDVFLGNFGNFSGSPGGFDFGFANSRIRNSLIYQTPNWGGFTAEALLSMDGQGGKSREDAVDMWNIGLRYANGPLFAGVTYVKFEGTDSIAPDGSTALAGDVDQWALGLGYEIGSFAIGFIYEDGETNKFRTFDPVATSPTFGQILSEGAKNYYGTVAYAFGNNIVRAAYGYVDPDTGEEVQNYGLGFQHNFSKRTRLWVEYSGRNQDTLSQENIEDLEFGDLSFSGDSDALSIGVRHDF